MQNLNVSGFSAQWSPQWREWMFCFRKDYLYLGCFWAVWVNGLKGWRSRILSCLSISSAGLSPPQTQSFLIYFREVVKKRRSSNGQADHKDWKNFAGSLRWFQMGGKYIFQDQNLACLSTFGRHFLGQVDADLKGRHHDEIPNLFKIKTCSRNAGGLWLNFFVLIALAAE